MRAWNEANIALSNAFAVASLISQVHPDESVRTRAEQAEQDAHRLQTEIGLDRDLYDVLAAVDPGELDNAGTPAGEGVAAGRGARRVLAHTLRDFRRAGVDRDEAVRERIRQLNERETEVAQQFSREYPRRRALGVPGPVPAWRACRRTTSRHTPPTTAAGCRSPRSTPTTCRS